MCFLKSLKSLDAMPTDDQVSQPQVSVPKYEKDNTSYLNSILKTNIPILANRQDELLFNLLTNLKSNSSQFALLQEKMALSQQRLTGCCANFGHSQKIIDEKQVRYMTEEESIETAKESTVTDVDPLVEGIFGKNHYSYRLKLQGEQPQILYKERNINIEVELVDKNGQKILNSNIVHLCLGVCDNNGSWIHQNRAGENFMKGKMEIELYHGAGSFLKIYPRDISRQYLEGKINFIIYARPSVLKFQDNNSTLEKDVDCSRIEPLILRGITVKAKKRD